MALYDKIVPASPEEARLRKEMEKMKPAVKPFRAIRSVLKKPIKYPSLLPWAKPWKPRKRGSDRCRVSDASLTPINSIGQRFRTGSGPHGSLHRRAGNTTRHAS